MIPLLDRHQSGGSGKFKEAADQKWPGGANNLPNKQVLTDLLCRVNLIQGGRLSRYAVPGLLLSLICLTGGCRGAPEARSVNTPRGGNSPRTVVWADGDSDGLPDAVELHSFNDRLNFRRWMTGIAELQFYRLSEAWNEEQRDCAGLVRFAWREALRRHDRQWFQAMGEGYEVMAPDIQAYNLDRGPLGEKLFRTDFGSFVEADPERGKFSEYADARTLKNHNARFIGRDIGQAQSGDLLFFHQPWVQKYPYHVMIFLGEARLDGEGARDWVVYHTGTSPQDQGEMKKVRVAVLRRHPDPRWRPIEANRNFLGFYRLRILE